MAELQALLANRTVTNSGLVAKMDTDGATAVSAEELGTQVQQMEGSERRGTGQAYYYKGMITW